MSDAPETIWTCAHVGEYGHYFPEAVEAEAEYGGTATAYRRADLPPTLSAAMQLPEVQALVEAAERLAEWAEQLRACGDAGNWEWTAGDEYSETIAALSAAKGAADADR